jgi:hypothetical protein
MAQQRDVEALERGAYRATYSDGIIDIFVGISLMWVGAVWIWLPDLGGLAGIFPAVFIAVMLTARKRFLEARLGYVKWREPRRRWERRNLVALLGAGIALLVVGVAVFVVVRQGALDSDAPRPFAPGLMAWLLALLAMGLAFLMSSWRMLAYAGVLAAAGLITVWAEARPGWPLLVAGVVITATGIVMFARLVRRHPVMETP